MKIYQKRRVPIYVTGFLVGTMGVLMLSQVKKATAPSFAETKVENPTVTLATGGSFKLTMGEEPGHYLIWGFPTQLAVGRETGQMNFDPVVSMEYKDLVEKETFIGPFDTAGRYELRAQFFACAFPGEKYCAKLSLTQPFEVKADVLGPKEIPLAFDAKAMAKKASDEGLVLEAKKASEGGDKGFVKLDQAVERSGEKAPAK